MKFIRYILFFAICLCYLNPTVIFAADGERVVEGILADSVSTKELNVTEGNFRGTTVVNAATYDLLTTDYILLVTYTSAGAVTSLTLPTAQCIDGRLLVIKDSGGNSSINNITIDTEGAEKIDGEDTAVIGTDYNSINLVADGSNWNIW